jgi:hypothetical protein
LSLANLKNLALKGVERWDEMGKLEVGTAQESGAYLHGLSKVLV